MKTWACFHCEMNSHYNFFPPNCCSCSVTWQMNTLRRKWYLPFSAYMSSDTCSLLWSVRLRNMDSYDTVGLNKILTVG